MPDVPDQAEAHDKPFDDHRGWPCRKHHYENRRDIDPKQIDLSESHMVAALKYSGW